MERDPYMAELKRRWETAPDPAHDIGHINRVWKTCQRLSKNEDGDLEVLHPAAIFHDLVALPKSDPHRATASSRAAEQTVAFLASTDFPKAKIPAVAHAIQAYSFSANVPCETREAKILQDADRLDALGAIGIARCFAVSGDLGRALFHPTDPMAQNRPLDEETHALDHFQTKLFKIAETLHTQTAKDIAKERVAYMKAFCATLTHETL